MKPVFYKNFLLLTVLFSLSVSSSYGQTLTGIWRGYFITESSDQYKFELQIEQKKNSISGVSYSYLTTVFYGKATLTGSFSSSSQNALIQEIKTVEVKMGPGSSACIMKCSFQYVRSGKEEFLEGTFTSRFEKNTYGAKKGDNCGSGKVYLRKVQSSDFYIEPFLRKELADNATSKGDSVITEKKAASVKKPAIAKPGNAITSKPANKTKTNKPTRPATAKENIAKKPDNAPVNTIEDTKPDKEPESRTVIKKRDLPTPTVMKLRENNLVQTINCETKNVSVRIYDNGEIDDDTISVYLDKKLVLSKQKLTASPLVVNIKMDEDDAEHELVMVADNLGRIPPNTSLMIVNAGDQRYEVRITSNEQKNAVVRFVYHKPG
ncbi:MAG: hypothetical protein JST09_18340 [Bacteroidetes bacterium]|nr:hypothetical protein [Bacteroidota bacterium]MBS1610482.1 hypothetical protein [Bacteroidota bacterium]